MYQQIFDRVAQRVTAIKRLSDGACIPLNRDNRDYAEFLKWQRAGGVVLPPASTEPMPTRRSLEERIAELETTRTR